MTLDELKAHMHDKWWRMNNLYHIIDRHGKKVLFRCNEAQTVLFNNMWYMNLILKDRQRGMTTFIDLYILDDVLFYPDLEAGIIAHKEADAIKIFRRKIKYPYEHLPDAIKRDRPLTTKRNDELSFPNNSYVYVSTSMRSGTVNRLHLSEFGKVCAKYPEKAKEIVSGSLEAVHPGSIVWIESTAEGREGYFYNYCMDAQKLEREKRNPTKLEFKLFFFGWTGDQNKRTSEQVPLTSADHQYFDRVEKTLGIQLDDEQKWWYAAKKRIQREEMKKENPATPEEAFEAAIEGAYYSSDILEARESGRITKVPHIEGILVDTWWDLGYDDSTAIWFTQTVGREIHVISYYEAHNEGLLHYAKVLDSMAKEGGWIYGYHKGPHDTLRHELGTGKTIQEQGQDLKDPVTGKKYPLIFSVAERITEQQEGIEAVRSILPYCWFDEENTTISLGKTSHEKRVGLPSLENYRKEYDEKRETFLSRPLHNWASHGAKAFETMAISHQFGCHESDDLRAAFG
uniref:Putative terminase n=1 Tax=viral metagenome TaxID=1070528 RepID=A0A6M3K993_9ZZZZ